MMRSKKPGKLARGGLDGVERVFRVKLDRLGKGQRNYCKILPVLPAGLGSVFLGTTQFGT